MKKTLSSIFTLLVIHGLALGQAANISGALFDSSNDEPIVGATVLMLNIKDSTLSKYSISDAEGRFIIQNLDRAFYKLQIQSVGYITYRQVMRIQGIDANLGSIKIKPDVKVLSDVKVQGFIAPVEQKGDTIQYNAAAYKVNPDANTTDLVSKMPGIVIDQTGVTANGESVQQVLLDGKRFFGQDPLLSLNTIPAEIVDKVEVFDQQSERSQFTGVDDGNTTKTMNVVTKEDKRNGQFGNVYAGYGTDDHYRAGGTINSFKKDQRLTVLGMSNDINQQNFSSEDLAGLSGQRRGFRRGGSNSLMVGTQDGITQTHAAGVNFTDDWGDKGTFEGSYFFNQSFNDNDQLTNREIFQSDSTQSYLEDLDSYSENLNHRLRARVTYNINEDNKVIFRPSISYQDNMSRQYTLANTTNESGSLINQTDNNYLSQNTAFNLNNYLSWQHKFEKIGRSMMIEIQTQNRNTDRENYYEDMVQDSVTQYLTDEINNSISTKIEFSEPVGLTGQLSGSYKIKYDQRNSDKRTYLIDPNTENKALSSALSNDFESAYITHTPEVSFTNNNMGKFMRFSLAYQHATLNNDQLLPEQTNFERSFNNFLPMAMGKIDLKNGHIFLRYSTSTTAPSVTQLQNVINNSNPIFISLGNPSLDQSYSHSFMMRINAPNTDKNRTFANFTRATMTSNYIGNQTTFARRDSVVASSVFIQRGAQISQPMNFDGYWSIMNNSTYSILLEKLKSNINLSLRLNYQRIPGMTNGISNIADSYSGNTRVSFVSNISEKVDYNLYYQVSGNQTINSFQENSNTSYYTQTIGLKSNFIFWKGLVFRNNVFFEKYNGISDSFNSAYILWNMSVAKKFLKNDEAEIELSVYDLLGQNQSFSQTVGAGYVEEIRTQVLRQYFMLTLTYQLRRFKTK
ncbi:outer membrane beta-barrel protein [Reichenbachiella versicolor]|uniref:outer membrane beta-barrel protein n=1 Tax=Reichenbachiella versicolor TaxID=1821036 RepID=UPI000D6E59DD|nr:outer membrane beta-barrel protein [Reichenbachiella versicolor]